jgi:hypothetical protein
MSTASSGKTCIICGWPVPLRSTDHLCELHGDFSTPPHRIGTRRLDKDGRVIPWRADENGQCRGAPMSEQLTLFAPPALDGEILEADDGAIGDMKTLRQTLRSAMRCIVRQESIDRYLAAFGAVPREQPYRQWLCVGRDQYVHIADVWKDPELRERVLTRLRRGSMSWKRMFCWVQYDLEYLDEFARRGDAAVSERTWIEAMDEYWRRERNKKQTALGQDTAPDASLRP